MTTSTWDWAWWRVHLVLTRGEMAEDPRLLLPPALLQLFDQAGHVSLVPVTLTLDVLSKAEINGVQPSVAGPGCLFRIRIFPISDPGSKKITESGPTSASKYLSILTPKIVLISRIPYLSEFRSHFRLYIVLSV